MNFFLSVLECLKKKKKKKKKKNVIKAFELNPFSDID